MQQPNKLLGLASGGFRGVFFLLMCAVACAGVIITLWQEHLAQQQIHDTALSEARMIAAALDPLQIAALQGSASDLKLPAFQHLQAQIRKIQAANPRYKYLYLMGQRTGEPPFFYMGTAPDGSPEYSPPGQPYPENPPSLRQAFFEQAEVLSPPVKDRWGTWVSALVPVHHPATGQFIALFGMDMNAAQLYQTAVYRALVPIGLTLFALAALLVFRILLGTAMAQETQRQLQATNTRLEQLNTALEEQIQQHYRDQQELQDAFARTSEINSQLEEETAELNLASQELRASEERYKLLFELANDAILILEEDVVRACNQRALAYFRCAQEDLVGSSVLQFSPEYQPSGLTSALAGRQTLDAAKCGQPQVFEWNHLRADGTAFTVETSLNEIKLGDGSFVLAIIRDITEHKVAADALRLSEERYRLLAESAHEMIAIWNLEGKIVYANRAALETTGYTLEEAIGLSFPQLTTSEELERWHQIYSTRLEGDTSAQTFTSVIVTKDARCIPVEVSSIPIVQDGQITGLMHVGRDISDRLNAEKVQAQLAQTQKLEAIGTLAGGIAHDFNNILFAIIANAELLRDSLDKQPDDAELVDEILLASQRAKELVRQILAFSRRQGNKPISLRLNSVVKETMKLLRPLLPATLEMHVDVEGNVSQIVADPTEIHQVLMNLCTNAAHAIGDTHGLLEIRLKDVFLDQETVALYPRLSPGEYVQLTVSDNGQGMDALTRERIFEPFFTTKPSGLGTGMGLSVVHGIVTRLGGCINVYSEIDKGSTFHVYLPVAVEQSSPELNGSSTESPRGQGRLLVVDDEKAVTEALARILSGLGYTVTQCNSSPTAEQMFTRSPGDFDLVITDLTMPGLSGTQLARSMLTIRPDLPIILCTGFSHSVSAETAAQIGVCSFLEKPISRAELAQTTARLLGLTSAM